MSVCYCCVQTGEVTIEVGAGVEFLEYCGGVVMLCCGKANRLSDSGVDLNTFGKPS